MNQNDYDCKEHRQKRHKKNKKKRNTKKNKRMSIIKQESCENVQVWHQQQDCPPTTLCVVTWFADVTTDLLGCECYYCYSVVAVKWTPRNWLRSNITLDLSGNTIHQNFPRDDSLTANKRTLRWATSVQWQEKVMPAAPLVAGGPTKNQWRTVRAGNLKNPSLR